MRYLPVVLSLIASPAAATEFTSDAFGILPTRHLSEVRAGWSGLRSDAGGDVTVAPAAPDVILLFIGPKSLVAGKDDGHAVALVLDALGNPVRDGLEVAFELGSEERSYAPTMDGIADLRFMPEPLARTIAGGAMAGRVQSARALVRVTADLGSLSPVVETPDAPVSAESVATLVTGDLADRYGNPVEDGVATGWRLRHADGRWTLQTGEVHEEAAEIDFLARDVSANAIAQVTIGASRSGGAGVTLRPVRPVGTLDMHLWQASELEAVVLRIGPFLTDQGYVLSDGAPVTVSVRASDGTVEEQSGWTRDGYFEALLPLSPASGPFGVTVESLLGTQHGTVAPKKAPPERRDIE